MAIAFDAASGMTYSASSPLTISHTCTGSDRLLVAGCHGFTVGATFTATYNGVAMTEIANGAAGGGASNHYWFYLLNPASGANNLVFTASSGDIRGGGSSYTGAKQSAQPDASASGTDTTTPYQNSVTTIADNCWVIVYAGSDGTGLTSGDTNTTPRTTLSSNGIGDRNAATTPAGSVTLGFEGGSSTFRVMIASFAPAVAAGPANVKLINGITVANTKTLNGIAIANVKTVNGIA